VLGVLLAAMLLGLAVLIHRFHLVPRHGVTLLAQLTAAAIGTGLGFHVVGIAVTVVLLLAANTSYGGLPVLMSRLSHDNRRRRAAASRRRPGDAREVRRRRPRRRRAGRLPHLFSLRAEHQVYRYGVTALTLAAAALLVIVGGATQRLIPLFAIGVFIGFTISQAGLVRHWARARPRHWQPRAAVNGFGAVLTAAATFIFLVAKFKEGAWIVVLVVPLLIVLFNRIESYYDYVAHELALGQIPPPPLEERSLVIVPVNGVSKLTYEAPLRGQIARRRGRRGQRPIRRRVRPRASITVASLGVRRPPRHPHPPPAATCSNPSPTTSTTPSEAATVASPY
jgi:Amino acid permease